VKVAEGKGKGVGDGLGAAVWQAARVNMAVINN
jgi:hypothetical protein